MPLSDTEFYSHTDSALQELLTRLQPAFDEGTLEELELESGVMRIEHSDTRKWVVNRHEASGQIWLASATLGGLHFSWNESQQQWQLADGRVLAEVLLTDIGLS